MCGVNASKSIDNLVPPALGSNDFCPPRLRQFIQKHLTSREISFIWTQFQETCIDNKQVLWTGMPKEVAQKWADSHGMQTLTTAMGPYMDTRSSLCPRKGKSPRAWKEYIHGASALFALHISKGARVTVLCNVPPQRFHPQGNTSFQCIETPILTGELGNNPVGQIYLVHPVKPDCIDCSYQFWPEDHVSEWFIKFGTAAKCVTWRSVALRNSACSLCKGMEPKSNNIMATALQTSQKASQPTKPTQVQKSLSVRLEELLHQQRREIRVIRIENTLLLTALNSERKIKQNSLHKQWVKAAQGLRGRIGKEVNKTFSKSAHLIKQQYLREAQLVNTNTNAKLKKLETKHEAEIKGIKQQQAQQAQQDISEKQSSRSWTDFIFRLWKYLKGLAQGSE